MSLEAVASARKRDRSFDDVVAVAAKFEELAAALPPPRGTDWLLDLAGEVGCSPGASVLDAGGWAGHWARRLDDRYGSRSVVCDIAPAPIGEALRLGCTGLVADVEELPFRAQSFDLVWCRDMLSMVNDPARAVLEAHRVLKPLGGLVLYAAFPTDRLEPRERQELFAALGTPEWWAQGVQPIRELLEQTGFDVVSETRTSPEHTQAAIEARGDLLADWVSLARLERDPALFRDAIGDEWYERWRAWNRWSLYLLLGKLETFGWAARSQS